MNLKISFGFSAPNEKDKEITIKDLDDFEHYLDAFIEMSDWALTERYDKYVISSGCFNEWSGSCVCPLDDVVGVIEHRLLASLNADKDCYPKNSFMRYTCELIEQDGNGGFVLNIYDENAPDKSRPVSERILVLPLFDYMKDF